METHRQAGTGRRRRAMVRWVASFWAMSFLLLAARGQQGAPAGPTSSPAISSASMAASSSASSAASGAAAADAHGVLALEGAWRFQVGDDARWADAGFDDSRWQTVSLNEPLSEQGVPPYSGYAWYRLRLEPRVLEPFGAQAGRGELELLVTPFSVGQMAVYIDGVEAGYSKGMGGWPQLYLAEPFAVRMGAAKGDGARVIAIRSWAGAGAGPGLTVKVQRGTLAKVEIGTGAETAERLALAAGRQWNEQATAPLVLGFLFLCMAALGATLYLSQRHHAEYLWLALMGLAVAAEGGGEAAYGLALLPVDVYRILSMFAGRVFMAVTLEFVLRFTAGSWRRTVRAVQAAVLLMPLASLAGLEQTYDMLSVAAEVVFCGLVCGMLFVGWRRGRQEAGVMLLPFFLASTADSVDTILDYAANLHWLPQRFASHHFHLGPIVFGTGTVSFVVFLGSLIAVILYRFVRVSQEEQRTAAEISAARSVQALLIPTHLPSNHNFMLDSAYLPVQGVGGDFFQALPLEDESLLLVVGDVSGKGLQAAMNSSTLVGALRNELSHDPKTILDHLNRVLLGAVAVPGKVPELDAAPCFATCLCARIYPDGRAVIANAGHLSPYRDGREMALEPSLPLGVIAGVSYEQSEFQLERGDRLVFLSDGVVEATNAQGELFGFERTQQVSHEPAGYIAQTAKRFGQTDDITVVSLYLASQAAEHAVGAEQRRS